MRKRDPRIPLVEQVRALAYELAQPDEELDFYGAALALGCDEQKAEELDEELTIRTMRARGAL